MSSPLSRFLVPGTDADVARAYASLSERARDAAFGFEDEVAFLDVETTGFDPSRDAVIEIAVLVARGPEVLERYATLIDPKRPIRAETTQLTGIDDAMVAGAPTVVEALERAAAVVGDRDIVAHNCSFDRAFLMQSASPHARALPGSWLDSLELARIALPRLRSHHLKDLAEAFALPNDNAHRAPDDVEATFALWRVCLTGLADLPAEILAAIAGLAPHVDWPLRRTLAHVAAAAPRPWTTAGPTRPRCSPARSVRSTRGSRPSPTSASSPSTAIRPTSPRRASRSSSRSSPRCSTCRRVSARH
jgi:ATP-dependent DNA helicase DinG